MALPSISIASVTIGFISFAFTLAIWLHAFWDWFMTISNAPTQVQDYLSTLRQGLYEEREHLKRLRGRGTSHGQGRKISAGPGIYAEGGPLKVMNDAVRKLKYPICEPERKDGSKLTQVKHLIREFKTIERPFLVTPHEGREKELEWSFDTTRNYYRCSVFHRVVWLQSKSHVTVISTQLSALQMRRVAVEVSESKLLIGDAMGLVRNVEDRLRRIEDRLRM